MTVAAPSQARICGRSLAGDCVFESCGSQWSRGLRRTSVAARLLGIAGSNPVGSMNVCVVCCKDKGTTQGNHDKETSTEKVQREGLQRKKILSGALTFMSCECCVLLEV